MSNKNADEQLLNQLRKAIEKETLSLPSVDDIPLFYEPIHYINKLSSKKLRPLLTMICGSVVGGDRKSLVFPAAAVELLHNFTLVHDDIMDNDTTRRGALTVHEKWDIGTAILAGDGLMGLAYKKLLKTPKINTSELIQMFTDAMLEICEGQALDKTFETMDNITDTDYFEMIGKKTAVLIELACKLGAIVGKGTPQQIKSLSAFGYELGMGFQIQDDLLDVLADEKKLGKKVGSDLAMNKKTILSIKLSEKLGMNIKSNVQIDEFKKMLDSNGVLSEVKHIILSHYSQACNHLEDIPNNKYKDLLIYLTDYIKNRDK